MASISNDGNKTRRLIFTRPSDGKRVAIRLGKVSASDAKTIKANVESLISAAISGTSINGEISRWLATIGDSLHASLAEHGLISARRRVALGDFVDSYIKSRSDVGSGTLANFATCKARLFSFFDRGRYLHDITAGDAHAWLVHLRKSEFGYAEATIGKTIIVVRQ